MHIFIVTGQIFFDKYGDCLHLLPLPSKVKEVMFSPLSVCLCTGYLKKLRTDPDEILWTGSVCDKDELVRFW